MTVVIINRDADFSARNIGKLSGLSLPAGVHPSLRYWILPRTSKEASEVNHAGYGAVTAKGPWAYSSDHVAAQNSVDYYFELGDFRTHVTDQFTVFAVSAFDKSLTVTGNIGLQSAFLASRQHSPALNKYSINLRYEGASDVVNSRFYGSGPEGGAVVPSASGMAPGQPMVIAQAVNFGDGSSAVYAPGQSATAPLSQGMVDAWSDINWAVALGRGFGGIDAGARQHYLFALFAKAMTPAEVTATAGLIKSYLASRGVPQVIGL